MDKMDFEAFNVAMPDKFSTAPRHVSATATEYTATETMGVIDPAYVQPVVLLPMTAPELFTDQVTVTLPPSVDPPQLATKSAAVAGLV